MNKAIKNIESKLNLAKNNFKANALSHWNEVTSKSRWGSGDKVITKASAMHITNTM